MKLFNFFMNSALDEIQCLLSSVKRFTKKRNLREFVLFEYILLWINELKSQFNDVFGSWS